MSQQPPVQWGNNSLYCEAVCDPQDVYYEGSDDDDYESPSVRRMRYEAAGRRFLNGNTPLMLSASLRGPFEENSGWKNPWRSKKSASKQHSRVIPQSPSKTTLSSSASIQPTADKSECHLPSPQSLKQASVEPHAYLQKADLNRVHAWRNAVKPTTNTHQANDECDLTPTRLVSSKKRRAKSSDWLQANSNKKRKFTFSDTAVHDTPSNRRARRAALNASFPASSFRHNTAANTSFQSAPARLASPRVSTPSKHQNIIPEHDNDELGEIVKSDRTKSSTRFTSPIKRLSPKRKIWCTKGGSTADSEDELAQDKPADFKAAKTLSSPVSLKNGMTQLPQPTETLVPRAPRIVLTSLESDFNTTTGHQVISEEAQGNHDTTTPGTDMVTNPQIGRQAEQESCSSSRPTGHKTALSHAALFETTTDPMIVCRPSSPLSSISSAFGSAPWSNMFSSTSEAYCSDIQAIADHVNDSDQDVNSNSHQTEKPIVHQDDSASQVLCDTHQSDVGSSDSDELSDISEPSMTRSSIEYLLSSQQNPTVNESVVGDTVPTGLGDASTDQVLKTEAQSGKIATPELESKCISGSEIHILAQHSPEALKGDMEFHVPAAGADELGSQVEEVPLTMADTSMTDTDQSLAIEDQYLPAEDLQTVENDSTASEHSNCPMPVEKKELTTAEATSSFCLKNIFQRLVSSSSWTKSQMLETEAVQELQRPDSDESVHDEAMDCQISEVEENAVRMAESEQSDSVLGHRGQLPSFPPAAASEAETGNETLKNETDTASQQGSWSKSQGTESFGLGIHNSTTASIITTQSNDRDLDGVGHHADAQSPWAVPLGDQPADAEKYATAAAEAHNMDVHIEAVCTSSPALVSQALMPARPTTPEFQFPIKPFAAFMTPSPEHRARSARSSTQRGQVSIVRMPGTGKVLASALKNPWSSSRTNRRVSWAPLPGENNAESPCGQAKDGSPFCLKSRQRGSSPPPTQTVDDIDAHGEIGFMDHFTAMEKRASGSGLREVPLEGEETAAEDSTPCSSAENGSSFTWQPFSSTIPQRSHKDPNEEWQFTSEAADINDQVFDDLQELLQPWVTDADLEKTLRVSDFDDLGMCV